MPAPTRPPDRASWAEIVVVAAFVCWAAWPLVSPGSNLVAYDTVTYAGPNLVVTSEQLSDGQLPVWNDELFGGVPHLANPQVGALSPIRWALAPLAPATALGWTIAVHLAVLAAGTYVLCWRRLRLAAPARMIGTIAIVGSGAITARTLQFEQITVVAWIPWLLAATDWLIRSERLRARALAATAAATALTILSGHPQQAYLGALAVAGWCAARAIDATRPAPTAPPDPRHRAGALMRRAGRVAAAVGLGAVLAAPQLVASAGLLRQAALEANQSLLQASSYGYVLKPELLTPTFLGNPFADTQWMTAMSSEAMAFVGVTAFVLALVGLAVGVAERSNRTTVALLGVGVVVATMFALGPQCDEATGVVECDVGGKVFRGAFALLPGFSQTRAPGRWALVASLALGLLAAIGADALLRRTVTRRRGLAAAAVAGALGSVVLLAGPSAEGGITTTTVVWWSVLALVTVAVLVATLRSPRPAATGAWVVAALVLVELGASSINSVVRDHTEPEPFDAYPTEISEVLASTGGVVVSLAPTPFDDAAFLSAALRPNTNATYGVRSLDGYDGGLWVTTRWALGVSPLVDGELDASLPLSWQVSLPLEPAEAGRAGIGYAVVDLAQFRTLAGDPDQPEGQVLDAVVPGWGPPVARHDALVLVPNPARRADGTVAFATVRAPDPDSAAAQLRTAGTGVAVVEGDGDALVCPESCEPLDIEIDRARPGRAVATLPDLSRPGVLSITAQPLPGWEVTVDGEAREVLAVDVLRAGVAVEPGDQVVEFRYRQPGLRLAGLLMVAGLVVTALCLLEPRWLRGSPPAR